MRVFLNGTKALTRPSNSLFSALVSNLESDLQSSHDKLRKLTNNNDGKIEK